MKGGLLHLHRRKRIHQKNETYPHPDPKIRLLDNIVTVVAVLAPLATIPQIYRIWFLGETEGVSPITWGLYFLFSFPFLTYGLVHKERPFIIMYTLWILMNGAVFLGTAFV